MVFASQKCLLDGNGLQVGRTTDNIYSPTLDGPTYRYEAIYSISLETQKSIID